MNTLSILFWIKKNRIKNGQAPISLRITVDGRRTEISVARKVNPLFWDPEAQMATGKKAEAKELNDHLVILKAKILQCHTKLESRNEAITAESVKSEYLGKKQERKTIVEVFKLWLAKLDLEVKKEIKSQATYDKYADTLDHLQAFIKVNYKAADRFLDQIDFSFIGDFADYLSLTKSLSQNTYMKYISITKTIFLFANQKGWLPVNPGKMFTCRFEYKDPLLLEYHELEGMYQKEMPVKRLEEARDVYVFMCYTGFGFTDTAQLTKENIFWGIDKQQWIRKDRQKTKNAECVPLLPIPLEIIRKYSTHPECLAKGRLLPVRTNSNLNGYLKEVAAICHINKELTTHSGRHTFATSVTLENDVPLETVSKMLGHKSIKSTGRYARVTKRKINNNMNELRGKLFPVLSEVKTGS